MWYGASFFLGRLSTIKDGIALSGTRNGLHEFSTFPSPPPLPADPRVPPAIHPPPPLHAGIPPLPLPSLPATPPPVAAPLRADSYKTTYICAHARMHGETGACYARQSHRFLQGSTKRISLGTDSLTVLDTNHMHSYVSPACRGTVLAHLRPPHRETTVRFYYTVQTIKCSLFLLDFNAYFLRPVHMNLNSGSIVQPTVRGTVTLYASM